MYIGYRYHLSFTELIMLHQLHDTRDIVFFFLIFKNDKVDNYFNIFFA